MAKKIRESARDQQVKARAAALEQRIEDLYARLRKIEETNATPRGIDEQ
jgi:hypothetical protein